MLIAIAAHFLAALALPVLARRWGRWVFTAGAAVPAASLMFVLFGLGDALHGQPVTESLTWAPAIGLEITLRLDPLALLMAMLVCGVGSLVLLYYTWYVRPGTKEIGRNSALLVAFAGAMLGLVVADDVFSLYIFWELTTVCSFLLVGGSGTVRKARRSAAQALLVTSFGGLAMLLGLILLAEQAGTYRISAIVAEPPSGTVTAVAVVLLLAGAATKSAQVPFHPWLPAAMVAPTPVSAYLHAAAMVKAGVYLVARFAPAFADLHVWWVPVVVLGLWTMLIGGFLALREHDLKTLLAFGTVSQLGFLMVLVGTGSYIAALSGATMVLAHGLFKSALFLTVGVIDKRAGTRDIRELSGLGKQWPVLTGCAVLACASMAGFPPLLGFVGKEAALEAFTSGGLRGGLTLTGLVAGSILTVAYSLRFLVGAFGTRAETSPVHAPKPGVGLALPVAVPALAGLVLAFGARFIEPLMAAAEAQAFLAEPTGQAPYHLSLWHGFTLPLLLSVVILVTGFVLYSRAASMAKLSGLLPRALDAQTGYRVAVGGLDTVARVLTARTQVGSLPVYIGVILLTVVLVPGTALITKFAWPGSGTRWTDEWLQVPLALLCVVAGATVIMARRRLTAVLLTGVIGYGIGALFLVEGAVDLAFAQFLVETLTLVVFVLVLRRFPHQFVQGRPPSRRAWWAKTLIASAGGIFVAVLALVFSGAREGLPPASSEYIANAQGEAGATNVVNAIIVDFRAFDTVGEIVVLGVAATGAASLILAAHRGRSGTVPARRRHPGQPPRTSGTTERHAALPDEQRHGAVPWTQWDCPRERWLGAGESGSWPRSLLLEACIRLVFPTVLVFSIYLLFAGHGNAGGGFSGGLVAGLAFVLRYVAGGRTELAAIAHVRPPVVIGVGLSIAVLTALAPTVFGEPVLTSAVWKVAVPLLGDLKIPTSLFLDIGVYLLIIGVVVDLLRTLGAGIETRELEKLTEEVET